MKKFYLLLAIVGALFPYFYFTKFIVANGADLPAFITQLFCSYPASGFTADILISSLCFWLFVASEAKKGTVRSVWPFVVANVLVGLSFAFPLFLYCRQPKQ